MRSLLASLTVLAGSGIAAADPSPDVTLKAAYETGPAYIAQNDGRYGANGTTYSAADVNQQDNLLRVRRTSLELGYGRHTFIALYAPFEARTQVMLGKDLEFRDEMFTAGTVVDHRYLFDGYRASYLYRLVDGAAGGQLSLELGSSLQVRNAEVAFTAVNGSQRASEDDIGLVYAVKARAWYRPDGYRGWAMFDGDGFSTFGLVPGVRGAIYDVQLATGYPVARGIDAVLGGRLLGGGADVKSQDIYNWGNFVSVTVGLRIGLDALLQ